MQIKTLRESQNTHQNDKKDVISNKWWEGKLGQLLKKPN